MSTIRIQILDLLESKPVSSTLELSRAVGVSKPAIQYHLKQLLEEGRIESIPGISQTSRRGRPVKRYRLANPGLPPTLAALMDGLLVSNAEILQTEAGAAQLAGQIGVAFIRDPDSMARLPFVRRISIVVDGLSRMGYQPHWEVHALGTRLLFRNCPFAHFARRHPGLCQVDRALLEHWLGLTVIIETCWRDTPDDRRACSFFFTR